MPRRKVNSSERTPPGLSEDLITKLQQAVAAAQRRRLAQPERRTAPRVDFPVTPGIAVSSTEEWEVYVTPGGRGRAAIARRDDGLFCVYMHWRVSGSWLDDDPDPDEVAHPQEGPYEALEDARRQLLRLRGFADAILRYSRDDPADPK